MFTQKGDSGTIEEGATLKIPGQSSKSGESSSDSSESSSSSNPPPNSPASSSSSSSNNSMDAMRNRPNTPCQQTGDMINNELYKLFPDAASDKKVKNMLVMSCL